MLLLHERQKDDGSLERLFVRRDGDSLALVVGAEEVGRVPILALLTVMQRYGRPLAEEVEAAGPTLDLGPGCSLQRFRHRSIYDVIARDFLLLRVPGEEPIAELATSVTAALEHLARAYARRPA